MTSDKNYRLGFTEKAKELISQMTFDEKVQLLAGNCGYLESMGIGNYNSHPYGAGGCKRLDFTELLFCDGPRGCVCGKSTCFPVTMGRGATFDPDLEKRVGTAIGEEIRAHGGNFYGGVCINVPYNPGGGRSQETYGEDTVHIAKMACSLVEGIQNENVIACIKHYAFNSMENSRFWVNVTADKRTEREVYLPHFQKCIEAGAGAVMSSYNRYNGKFNGANPYLLRKVLKGEWAFDGLVMSDFFFGLHSTSGGLNGGLDVEMNIRRKYTKFLISTAIKNKKATMEQVDEACLRVVRTLMAFTQTEDKKNYDKSLIASKEHIALAREVAEKSLTLIKNDNNLLPLDKKKIRKIAIVGNLAKIGNIGDYGSSQVHPPYISTFMDAMKKNYSDVNYTFIPTSAVTKRADDIKNADAVLIFCGMRHSDEGEYIFIIGGDRKKLTLRACEEKMINSVASLNKNTCAVVMGGNAIIMNSWKDKINSIIMAYYPGMEGGNAIADVVFGKVNPSGKLPFAIAKKESDYPTVKWIALNQHYDYYNGYKKLDKDNKTPDFPFGFGLSYTSFEIGKASFIKHQDDKAYFEVSVKNIGERAGAEVVQLYVGTDFSGVDRPKRKLADFVKIQLEPGEEKTVTLVADSRDFAYYDEKCGFIKEDIEFTAYIGNDEQSCVDNKVIFEF